ncbi:hypothetical protein BCU70_09690 [Vibrio sp. 10N.286.49.C2]|uniref:transporter substrate-binding domain-containing protein n=1 Tax=unclassified Vibrio TaxID=2614977 RepID=UPI000C82FE22|nr:MULTISPECIES: transporter substrate-binding domain-containing protein [unclassified Vibrio]PMH26414.1 hypothetical protein BCU70_09690 [Vibrio sp. 10N.286.49.C2]PMH54862.1 hypothetical protein BCU66_11245 [Vibrio sp. 10N.286.49.B1]PMH84100.1 hypothetical protein BCU58_00090 [Vibrio sp. 10N.286.48.B7]
MKKSNCINRIAIILFVFLLPFNLHAEIKTPMVFPGKDSLILELVELALQKSGKSHTVNHATEYLSDARLVEEVRNGHIDLIWAGASQDLQNQLQAVKIPIFKGLAGYRTFVIEKNSQYKFATVRNIHDLRTLKAGLGRFWSDTKILEAAHLNVIKPVKADSLFHMVEGGRFDFLPLGVHESRGVVEAQDGLNLAVEDNILLVYPSAMYFYVSKQNTSLFQDINNGLEIAIKDGSFNEIFYNSELIRTTFETSKLTERVVINIDNPYLPKDAPIERKELWLDINR